MSKIIYALDFETSTNPGDGLNPTNPLTSITSAAIFFGPLDANDTSVPTGAFAFDDPVEERLLLTVRDFFQSPWTKPGTIVTWNGASFDIAFLITRAAMHNIPLFQFQAVVHPDRKPKYGALKGHTGGYALNWGKHTHADIWTAYNDIAANAGIKAGLKPVAELLGLNPVKVDASNMESLTIRERMDYNTSDVQVTYQLATMLADLYEEGVVPHEFSHYEDSNLIQQEAA